MKAINFVIFGLSHRGYAGCVVNAKTVWRVTETLAVKPGLSTWFGLGREDVKAARTWWQAHHLANVATPVFHLEGT